MKVYFADTSALAKRYIIEVGTGWVRRWIIPSAGNLLVVSQIAPLEMASLLSRRQREKSILPVQTKRLYSAFMNHYQGQYLIVGLDEAVMDSARLLLFKHSLRTLDAIQLASALEATKILSTTLIFTSADTTLLKAASDEGLKSENPLAHP